MSNVLTSSLLINSIKRRAMIPSDQSTFTDADFLDMLNEEIQYFGVPHLLRTHEEYLLTFVDIPIEQNKREYTIPYRSIGNKLRDVAYIDSANNFFELSRISVEDLSDYNEDFLDDYTEAFYVQDNKIILVDEVPFGNGAIRMYFYLRPNTLVANNRAGVISSIDRTTGVITVSNFFSDFSNLPQIDFVAHRSPNKIYSFDITPIATNSTTKTLTFTTTDIPQDLIVGDYINIAGESIVPQLPTELHPILAQRTAVAALEAINDTEGVQVAQRRLEMMEQSVNTLIDNRVEGAPQKIVNRHSPLREVTLGSTGYRRRGRY